MRVAGERKRVILAAAALLIVGASKAFAMCGCDKPPPPRANVRPFVAYPDQVITLFDDRIVENQKYIVRFTARDGSSDWSRGRGVVKRDFADRQLRNQLRVAVPDVAYGPSQISVYDVNSTLLYTLSDDQFAVIGRPIALHDFNETITRKNYQTGVAADGTIFIAFDATDVSDATMYTGTGVGAGLRFQPNSVVIYNAQGFFGGWLDPNSPGLFRITAGSPGLSDTLAYWRHEFRTYKEEHRKRDARRTADGEWHADGTPHVDNFHFVVAIAATLDNGQPLPPGASPAFDLVISSTPEPSSDL